MDQAETIDTPSKTDILREIKEYVTSIKSVLSDINSTLHNCPETAWEEYIAHDKICDSLEGLGFHVRRKAFGLTTSFEARAGQSGPLINFNAEYDALPGIGHACGHNLIATAGVTGFLASAYIMTKHRLVGQVSCLGTPAEEAGGGKIALLKAGAYRGVTASLMVHPFSEHDVKDGPASVGTAAMSSLAIGEIHATYHGKSSHAALYPWDGVNALDAVVSSYCNISMLRQQLHVDERIHGCIKEAPKISNAIPHFTRLSYSYRSPTMERLRMLEKKVRACLEAGAVGTGCRVDFSQDPPYSELVHNGPLSASFQSSMGQLGHKIAVTWPGPGIGSTDQGNVSHAVPALHGVVAIPTKEGSHPHQPSFAEAAGSKEAFERIVDAGMAMALTAINLLTDAKLRQRVHDDFRSSQG